MLFDEASSETPQVRHFSGVPRAVFEACSARPPVAVTFQASFPFGRGSLTTAGGTIDSAWRTVTAVRRCHRGSQVTRSARIGTVQLRLPGGVYVFAPSSSGHRRLSQPRDVRETSLGWDRLIQLV